MRPATFLRYAALPARPNALILIIVLALAASLAVHAGLLGIPLAVLVLSWLLQYSYVLLENVAHGRREPPILAVEMLNPVHEPRPALQLLIVLCLGSLILLAYHWFGAPAALALSAITLTALPASIGALTLSESVWQAINPVTLWRLAVGLRWTYWAIVAVAIAYGSVLALWQSSSPILTTAVFSFAWLSLYALIGGGIYEAREELGHEAIDTPERRAERVARELERERAAFLDQVYGQARGGNLAGAWKTIERELAAQHYAPEFYDWLLQRLEALPSDRLANRLAQDDITRALSHDNGRVLRVMQRRLRGDASFRPRTGAETLRVAELAGLAGDRRNALVLLQDFGQQFPADAGLAQALQLQQSLSRSAHR